MHKNLAMFYLLTTLLFRLDDLINLLLLIENDDFLRHSENLLLNESDRLKRRNINESRHERGLKIKDIHAFSLGNSKFEVKSSKSSLLYQIERKTLSCKSPHCTIKCMQLPCVGLCEHMYTCNCEDRNPLCKHIHKIHAVYKEFEEEIEQIKEQVCEEYEISSTPEYKLYDPVKSNGKLIT